MTYGHWTNRQLFERVCDDIPGVFEEIRLRRVMRFGSYYDTRRPWTLPRALRVRSLGDVDANYRRLTGSR